MPTAPPTTMLDEDSFFHQASMCLSGGPFDLVNSSQPGKRRAEDDSVQATSKKSRSTAFSLDGEEWTHDILHGDKSPGLDEVLGGPAVIANSTAIEGSVFTTSSFETPETMGLPPAPATETLSALPTPSIPESQTWPCLLEVDPLRSSDTLLPNPNPPLEKKGALISATELPSSTTGVDVPNKTPLPHLLSTLQMSATIPNSPSTPLTPRGKRESAHLEALHDVWSPSKPQELHLQSLGISIRRGAWSKAEEAVLLRNMDELKQVYQTHDIAEYVKQSVDKKKTISKDFYRALGKGISRPLQAVYRRFMRQIVDETEGKGKKYSEEDLVQVRFAQSSVSRLETRRVNHFSSSDSLSSCIRNMALISTKLERPWGEPRHLFAIDFAC
eukprot:m.219881 g.219881  ORF g.219881 m.219881 type:complete len:386 (+) comp15588_c0_seq2:325-1482(+)